LAFYLLDAASIIRSYRPKKISCFFDIAGCTIAVDTLNKHKNNYSNVSEMFDQISATYDRANRFLSLGLDLHWRRSLANHLPRSEPLSLLDLATGTGDQIASLIQKKAPIRSAVGIDLSEKMLDIAKHKLANQSVHCPIQFQKADAENLPFEDQTFDLCTFSFGIRNIQKPLLALSEMHRVTKKSGRCLILEFSLPHNRWRFLYLLYLRRVIPYIGGLFAKDRSPYRHLNQTIEKFASGEDFLEWMRQTGWKDARSIDLFLGLVTIYQGDKR
jgi:demethylmenaquinone methyltransferase / 2-methoxy-6-polyprenyl-1,4-benzoquinol methylase